MTERRSPMNPPGGVCSECYETGYADGENNANDDWATALEEHLGLTDIKGPQDFIARVTRYRKDYSDMYEDPEGEWFIAQ